MIEREREEGKERQRKTTLISHLSLSLSSPNLFVLSPIPDAGDTYRALSGANRRNIFHPAFPSGIGKFGEEKG